jgi:endonuclease-3
VAELKKLLMALKRHYGSPALPVATGPFELVILENACYLLPEARRTEVFATLQERVGMSAEAIWKAPRTCC